MAEIVDWLTSLGLQEYAPRFLENRIDFSILADLIEQDAKDLGISAIGDRRKLMRAIAEMSKTQAAPAHAGGRQDARACGDTAIEAPAQYSTADVVRTPSSAAERRHLTVMFCDLVGSTALAARLDPEDVREVVRAYQGACAQAIAAYDGFVAQYLGDGIMAYFGYPQAHEDDAERAVRAGLDLVAAVTGLATKAKMAVRVGIATGLVVIGLIGEHAAKEPAVTGETPNLAARLQGLAAPGAIVVSAATRRLLGSLFELRDLGPKCVKGLNGSVQAFSVDGVRSFESRFEARAGGLTGFIGREEESDHLLGRKKLAWQGRGQVVVVSGEAGIGKSRLTAWLVDKIAAEPHTRLRYQCTPHHKDSALYPFITQLERAAGFSPGDTAARKLEKLEALLALAELETVAAVPLFAALLAIPTGERYPPLELSPAQQRQRTMAAMLDQTEALGRRKPILLIFEDAHWADATSLELLDLLVDCIGRLPVLAIVTGRPEFSPAWAGRHVVSTLPLTRLDRGDARAMVDSVTGGAKLPADLLEHIVAKTDGVPLFVEELTKTVLESGLLVDEGQNYRLAGPLPAFAIPATLQDSLMARLDRSNPVKEIAQIGAAIGREFSYKLLVAVAGMSEASVREALGKLEEAELATRRGVPPDASYTFKHALVQDAAYESLLKSRRQTIHRRIAKALRDRFPVLAETEPEIIAHHFTQATRAEQAVEWWTSAGQLALRRSASVEATSHFERAIRLADGLSDTPTRRLARFRLQVAYGNALIVARGYTARETIAAFDRCTQLGSQIEDVIERFAGFYGTWVASLVAGQALRARELAETFMREIGAPTEGAEAAIAYRILGTSRWLEGDYVRAIPHLESGLADYDAERDLPLAFRFGQDVGMTAMIYLALALWPSGQVDRARIMVDRAIAHANTSRHQQTLAYAHTFKALYEAILFNAGGTRVHAREAIALGREHDMPVWVSFGTVLLGWACWRTGEPKIGSDLMREGSQLRLELGNGFCEPLFAMHRAEALAEIDPKAALSSLRETLDDAGDTGQHWLDAEIHRRRGEILVRHFPMQIEAAEAAFGQALAVSRAQQTRAFELRASLDLARLSCETGREREARDLLAGALVGFTETPELPEIGEAQRLLASLGGEVPAPSAGATS